MKYSSRIMPMLLLLLLSPAVNALDRDAVLANLIESYGGENNLLKLETMVQEWDFVALRGNRHGKDVRSIRMPRQLRVELIYPNKKETRILNGDSSHVIFDSNTPQVASGPQHDAMRLQLMRLYSPLELRNQRDSLKLVLDGEYCALSILIDDLRVDYLVNLDNWRIEKVAGTLSVNGIEMQFLTEYSDFSVVDGVLIHHRENKFAGGVNTAVLQLRKVQLGAVLDSERFLPQ